MNRKKIQIADKIAQEWIDKIMKDYKSSDNILKTWINFYKDFVTFKYILCENPSSHFSDKDLPHIIFSLEIGLMGKDDFTDARLELTKHTDYYGDGFCLLGQDFSSKEDGEIFYSPSEPISIEEKGYLFYVSISKSKASEVVEFFKKEWEKKLPKIKNDKNYNYITASKLDSNILPSLKSRKKEYESKTREELEEELKDEIYQKMRYSDSEINSYFLDIFDIDEFENARFKLMRPDKHSRLKIVPFKEDEGGNLLKLDDRTISKIEYILIQSEYIEVRRAPKSVVQLPDTATRHYFVDGSMYYMLYKRIRFVDKESALERLINQCENILLPNDLVFQGLDIIDDIADDILVLLIEQK
jgi:hypothetical protein